MADDLSRTPPAPVRLVLRREVGFGCPVPGCRSPFLQYHHFDPPWHVEHHHRPDGMIPLCPTHHGQADAFTDDQLRGFKKRAHERPAEGRFEWLRRDLVGVVGGWLYHETPVLVQYGQQPVIYFNRDEANNALLNVRMLGPRNTLRMQIVDNDFVALGDLLDFECPPSGRVLRASYSNGDRLGIEFRSLADAHSLSRRVPGLRPDDVDRVLRDQWPATFVFVTMSIAGSLVFSPTIYKLGHTAVTGNVIMSGCSVGLQIG